MKTNRPYSNTMRMRKLNKQIRSGKGGKAQIRKQRKRRTAKGGILLPKKTKPNPTKP